MCTGAIQYARHMSHVTAEKLKDSEGVGGGEALTALWTSPVKAAARGCGPVADDGFSCGESQGEK